MAYLQFISARVDSTQMGAVQGALSASGLMAYILGSNLFTVLSVGVLSGTGGMLLDWSRGHGCGMRPCLDFVPCLGSESAIFSITSQATDEGERKQFIILTLSVASCQVPGGHACTVACLKFNTLYLFI